MKPAKCKIKKITIPISIIAASLCFVMILFAQSQKGKSNNPSKPGQELQITASTDNDKKVFKSGEPIVLNLIVKNNDEMELFIVQSCISLDYSLTVKNERGQLVPLTKEGERRTNRSEVICPLRKVKIEPGKSQQAYINLSTLYDVSVKGKYYITVGRSARKNDNNWIRSESNTIQVIVE